MEQLIKKEDFHVKDGNLWLSTRELAEKLGFNSPRSISKIYKNYQDELDPFTRSDFLETPGGLHKTRMFEIEGCQMVALFAKTKKAKEYRMALIKFLKQLREGELGVITKKQYAEMELQMIDAKIDRIQDQIKICSLEKEQFVRKSKKLNFEKARIIEKLAYYQMDNKDIADVVDIDIKIVDGYLELEEEEDRTYDNKQKFLEKRKELAKVYQLEDRSPILIKQVI